MLHSCASNECSDVMSSEIKVNKASLAGKIAFVKHINPAQGQRFQAEFERINSRDSKKANSEDRPGH